MQLSANLVPSIGGTRIHDAGRVARGARSYAAGQHAETDVAARYVADGGEVLDRRWRGPAGEIDLIVRDGDVLIFVEVKRSTSHELAAQRIDRRQMDRICLSAMAYCERLPTGSMTEMRFDAALVDDAGQIEIIPNAFGWH